MTLGKNYQGQYAVHEGIHRELQDMFQGFIGNSL
jgi:hypothetical protein